MNELTSGREPVTYIEIEQDFCSLRYGVAPCAAALGVTGRDKCFNTMRTCQDAANYTPSPLVLRFCMPAQDVVPGLYAIPSVISVSTAPTIINPGGGGQRSGPLGQRAQLKVVFQDHPSTDNVVDPYVGERAYDPLSRGTYWSKWLARNPYYNNRIIRVRDGYKGQNLADMVVRTYLIDKIDGPDSSGRVTVTAKDVLKLADNDKAQAPHPSKGELMVEYGKDDAITALRVTGAPAGDYPAPGTVRINRELLTYTTVSTVSDEEIWLNGIARATDGSERGSHKAGDRVQLCLRYTNVRVDALAYEWLTEYGSVPVAFIPYAAWQAEAALWLQQFDLTGLITEPTGVTDLLSEITEQCLFHIWWDERKQEIKLEALKPPIYETVPKISDDRNIVADSVKLKDEPASRVTQVWVFWGQNNPAERITEESNYRRIRVRADLDAESDKQFGEQKIRKVYSRWLHTEGQVINLSTRLLGRFRDTPKHMTVDLDAKDRALWTGSVVDVTHYGVVSFTGQPVSLRWQVISAEEIEPGHKVRYELDLFEYQSGGGRPGRWMAADAPRYEDATDAERETGMWWGNPVGNVGTDFDEEGYVWS